MKQTRNRSTQGYALVMSLLLLAATSVSLVGIANAGWRANAAASHEREALRARWAAITLERCLSTDPERLLRAEGRPVASRTGEVAIDGGKLLIVIQNEQAELNVNQLWQVVEQSPQRFSLVVNRWQTGGQAVALSHPHEKVARLGQLLVGPSQLQSAEEQFTTFGDGRVDFRACDQQRLSVWMEAVASRSAATTFVACDPAQPLETILSNPAFADDEKQRLRAGLLEGTNAVSIHMIMQTPLASYSRQTLLERHAATWHREVLQWR